LRRVYCICGAEPPADDENKSVKNRSLIVSLVAASLCLALWCAPAARSQTPAPAAAAVPAARPAQLQIVTRTLDNGLRLVMVENHNAPVISLQMWYHVGSKDERPGHTGFAHLFEHLMFQGSAHVAPEQHTRVIEALGGESNADTQDDVTVFYETFPSNALARVMWLEADRMGGLQITEEHFESEREVVEEERRLRVDNEPYGRVIEDLYAAAFTVHPYKHTTIGSMADLDKATLADVQEFFHTYYRPDNCTMILVGDFSADGAVAMAEKYFGGIPKPTAPVPRVTVVEPPQTAERTLVKTYPDTPLPAFVYGYKMPAEYSPDSYALDLVSNLLASGESSWLYRKLVYEDRIAAEVEGGGNFTEDPNLFFVIAVMNQGHTNAEGEKETQGVLDQIKAAPLDAHDLEKAKNQQTAAFILGRESDEEVASALGPYAVIGGDPGLYNSDLERYLSVTPEDIARVAKQYFVPEHATLLEVDVPPAPVAGN
jgi:zinc protease